MKIDLSLHLIIAFKPEIIEKTTDTRATLYGQFYQLSAEKAS